LGIVIADRGCTDIDKAYAVNNSTTNRGVIVADYAVGDGYGASIAVINSATLSTAVANNRAVVEVDRPVIYVLNTSTGISLAIANGHTREAHYTFRSHVKDTIEASGVSPHCQVILAWATDVDIGA